MEEYEKLTKEELIEKLYKLENDQKQVEKKTSKRSKKIQKPFDFSNTRARHVALKVAYQGEKYFGFTGTIDDPIATIEKELFTALIKCKLIPAPDSCGFARAGRTDKGVSGFGQVISLWVRSNLPKDSPLVLPWDEVKALKPSKEEIPETIDVNMDEDVKELSYIATLNRLLPKEIRILAWSPVSKTFDARYSCKWRKYKYLFPSKQLDIEKMKQAAALFIGTFDCRFICKLDPDKVDYPDFYTRTIYEAEIEKVNDDFSVFIVRGRAFLWHQVRNMMSLLFMVGKGLEEPTIISTMLDVSKHPPESGRPQYDMAPDAPLILIECGYENLNWRMMDETPTNNSQKILSEIDEQLTDQSLKVLQLQILKQEYLSLGAPIQDPDDLKQKSHIKLMKRKRGVSFEALLERKRQKESNNSTD